MCAVLVILLTGPRILMALWYLIAPRRWEAAFDMALWPILGFIFIPWTTLMFVLIAPGGNVDGSDWLWLALGFMADFFGSLGGGILRRRSPAY